MDHIIVINKVQWKLIDSVNFVVERNGRRARVIFKNGIAKLFQRNLLTGRFLTQRVNVQ